MIQTGNRGDDRTQASQVLRVGAAVIAIPSGLEGRLMSAAEVPRNCVEFVERSPERTIYHTAGYIEFARRQNGAADVLVVRSHGTPLFALPIHPSVDGRWISTGYSGALFAPTDRESPLRASAAAFLATLRANSRLGVRLQQSAQAAAFGCSDRASLLASLLWDRRHESEPLFTRILTLSPTDAVEPGAANVDAAGLDGSLLARYDGDVRNQIRQALRCGLRVQTHVIRCETARDDVASTYRRFAPIQVESFVRTGMTPHETEYLLGLSDAVRAGGGADVVVIVSGSDGRDIAAVTCHAHNSRAIYWSGCSTAEGIATRANPLALHTAIAICASIGVTAFELGRFSAAETSEKEIAISRYKAQFRGYLAPISNLIRPPQTLRSEVGAISRIFRGRLPGLLAAVDRRLPGANH